jgi:GAF domain-containing protein
MNAVLQAIMHAAVDATDADQGWLLAREGARLRVVSAAGGEPGRVLDASLPDDEGTAGFVVSSAQPMALAGEGNDNRFGEGVLALVGHRPTSVLSVPCDVGDAVLGVLELVDKAGGASFSFDDIELTTILASVAGAALQGGVGELVTPPTPAELAGDLRRLARIDPLRYAAIASVISALLSAGT